MSAKYCVPYWIPQWNSTCRIRSDGRLLPVTSWIHPEHIMLDERATGNIGHTTQFHVRFKSRQNQSIVMEHGIVITRVGVGSKASSAPRRGLWKNAFYLSLGYKHATLIHMVYMCVKIRWPIWLRWVHFVVCVLLLSFRQPVMSNSLRPHGLQHASLPCPSLFPRICSNSYPLSQWCYQLSHPGCPLPTKTT